MKISKAILIAISTLLIPTLPAQAADEPSARTTTEGTTLTFPNGQKFTLPPGKGLLGPSSNPSSQVPFTNADGTLIAVNEQPMTKTSFIHVYVKGSDGRFTEVKSVNQKIRKAIPASVRTINTEFIRVERIEGKVLDVETVYDFISNPRKRLAFRIQVSPDGTISAAR
jgi:hypothetical protein